MSQMNKEVVGFMAGAWVNEVKKIEQMNKNLIKLLRGAVPSPQVLDSVRRIDKAKREIVKAVESMKQLEKEQRKLLKGFENVLNRLRVSK